MASSKFSCFVCLFLVCSSLSAASYRETQNQLKRVDAQINTLQKTLTQAHNKQTVLTKELSGTEKQIGVGIQRLRAIHQTVALKEDKIKQLQTKHAQLNEDLKKQQALLARHLRARYQMGEYQALKYVMNPEHAARLSRVLTYYQYLVQSRQTLIQQIDDTRKKIDENRTILHNELSSSLHLKDKLSQDQAILIKNKEYHTALMKSLNKEIQNKQGRLQEAQKNKNNLASLLRALTQQSVTRTSIPFAQMRRKLPYPVQVAHKSLKRMNQGVTFFADEGTPVVAVYPGKVVFSDWLRGYGLLLIIDHGQGFMTLYAHNESLYKRKGQMVHQNEAIASIGHTGGIKQNGLYFEIRVRGKAVSPLAWLR